MPLLQDIFNIFRPKKIEETNQLEIEISEDKVPVFEDPAEFSKRMALFNNNKDYQVSAALAAIFTKVSNKRLEVMRAIDEVRSFYLVDTILNQIADDALSPDVTTNDIFDIKSSEPKVQKEIDYLNDTFHLDTLVMDIVPDMLAYGDYTLSVELDGKNGIAKINDDVDQKNVVPISTPTEVSGYLVIDRKARKISFVEPYKYIRFSYGRTKMRVDLGDTLSQLSRATQDAKIKLLPKYVRIGKSLLYNVLSKVKELQLLEQLIPATKLSKLSSGSIIGVSVPSAFTPEKGMETAKAIEGLINKKIGVDQQSGQLTLENILSSAGRIKAIPIFGEKGQLQKFDYKQDEPDDLTSAAEDVRKLICEAIGIPFEVLFGGSNAENKSEFLKRYARYMRKLKAIQTGVTDGIRQIIHIHLINKDIKFDPSKINIAFKRKNIDIDNLDMLEFQDAAVSMLKNVRDFIVSLEGENGAGGVAKYDPKVFADYLNKQLGIIGLNNLILGPPESTDTAEPTEPIDTEVPPKKFF